MLLKNHVLHKFKYKNFLVNEMKWIMAQIEKYNLKVTLDTNQTLVQFSYKNTSISNVIIIVLICRENLYPYYKSFSIVNFNVDNIKKLRSK